MQAGGPFGDQNGWAPGGTHPWSSCPVGRSATPARCGQYTCSSAACTIVPAVGRRSCSRCRWSGRRPARRRSRRSPVHWFSRATSRTAAARVSGTSNAAQGQVRRHRPRVARREGVGRSRCRTASSVAAGRRAVAGAGLEGELAQRGEPRAGVRVGSARAARRSASAAAGLQHRADLDPADRVHAAGEVDGHERAASSSTLPVALTPPQLVASVPSISASALREPSLAPITLRRSRRPRGSAARATVTVRCSPGRHGRR